MKEAEEHYTKIKSILQLGLGLYGRLKEAVRFGACYKAFLWE